MIKKLALTKPTLSFLKIQSLLSLYLAAVLKPSQSTSFKMALVTLQPILGLPYIKFSKGKKLTCPVKNDLLFLYLLKIEGSLLFLSFINSIL